MAELITSGEVAEASFTPTRFRGGYDAQEVDPLIDAVVTTLRAYEQGNPGAATITSAVVSGAGFAQTSIRRGYDPQEVDTLLDRIVTTLYHFESDLQSRPDALS